MANDKNYVPLDLAGFSEKFDVVDYFLAESGMLEKENEEEGLNGAVANVELEDAEDDADEENPAKGSSS